jgi:hypothetical protein
VIGVVIVADLRGPVAWGADPIHFDGLLGAVDAIRHPGRSHPSRVRPVADMAEQHLPIAKPHAAGAWCWLASAGEIGGPFDNVPIFATKRRDVDDWDRLAAPVSVSAGPGKDYMIRNPGRVGASIRFICWGSRHQIRKDLKLLWGPEDKGGGFVGPLRRMGAGEVASWRIESVPGLSPRDVLIDGEGRTRRHLPASWVQGSPVLRRGAHAPPYWHPERQAGIVPVGERVELRSEVGAALLELARAG